MVGKRIGVACVVVLGVWAAVGGVAYALKVTPNPMTVPVTEGQSHLVTFALDAPIIALTPNPDVEVNFTIDDPTRVSLSTDSLVWPDTEWSQTRSLTVNALADGVHDNTNTVVVHYLTTSASEYYSNFAGSFTVSLTDIDPGPSTTTTTATTTTLPAVTSTTAVAPTSSVVVAPSSTVSDAPATLPTTGSSSSGTSSAAALLVISGATALALTNRRRR